MKKVLLMLGCVVALGGASNLVAMDLYVNAVTANGGMISANVALSEKKQLIADWLDTHDILDRVNDVANPVSDNNAAHMAEANALRGKAAKLRTVKDDIYAYVYENKALDFNPATADSFANKIEVYVTDLHSSNDGAAAASAEANLVARLLLHADHTGPDTGEVLPVVGGTALNTVTEASEFLKVFLNGSWKDTDLNHIPVSAATRKDESLHAAQILCHFGHDGQFNGHKLNGTYDLDDLVFAITKALFQRN